MKKMRTQEEVYEYLKTHRIGEHFGESMVSDFLLRNNLFYPLIHASGLIKVVTFEEFKKWFGGSGKPAVRKCPYAPQEEGQKLREELNMYKDFTRTLFNVLYYDAKSQPAKYNMLYCKEIFDKVGEIIAENKKKNEDAKHYLDLHEYLDKLGDENCIDNWGDIFIGIIDKALSASLTKRGAKMDKEEKK